MSGNFFVELQAVGVVDVVKLVVVDLHDLAQNREFLEEGRVVVFLPVDGGQILHQIPGLGALTPGEGLQILLHPLGDVGPVRLGVGSGNRQLTGLRAGVVIGPYGG